MKRLLLAANLLSLSLATSAQSLDITLPEPVWEFDTNTRPLQERESGLAPEEQEITDIIRPLIASQQYQEAADYLQQSDKNQFSAAMHFVHAQLYLSLNDMTRAEQSYLATLEEMPDFQRAHRGLGVIYLQQQELELARKHISRAIALGANDAQIYGQLSYINLENKQAWSAVSGYRQAMFLEPDNPQWSQGLLYALIASGDYNAARALLDQMLERDSENASLWLQHSNIALQTGNDSAALASLEMGIRLGNNTPANLLAAGQLHLQSGNLSRGVALLESTLELEPSSYADLVQTTGWLVQRGELALGERLVTKIRSRLDSLSSTGRSDLLTQEAKISLARGENEQGMALLNDAIAINPGNGSALLHLAGLHTDIRNYASAASFYSRAAVLDEVREQALLAHAQLAVDMKDYAQAMSLLEQARQNNPSRRDIIDNISVLSRIISLQQNSEL